MLKTLKQIALLIFYIAGIAGIITIPIGLLIWIWMGIIGLKILITGVIVAVANYGLVGAIEEL